MDEALHALLLANAAITARVGQRVYWGEAKQGDPLPAVVLTIISAVDHAHMSGGGYIVYRVQVDCIGADRPGARLLSRDVMAAINRTRNGSIRFIQSDGERETVGDAAGQRAFVVQQDYLITWRA